MSNVLKVVQLENRLSMLLINEAGVLNWPEQTLTPALSECYHPCVASLDLSHERLKDIAEFAVDETARLVKGLGIRH